MPATIPSPGQKNYQLDPVLDFMRILWSIEHALQRVSKRMDATLGVTGAQRLVLLVVSRYPGLSAGDLARILQLHPSTITGILQRLQQKRLLTRTRDSRDNRRIQLYVQARSRAFTRRQPGTVEAAVMRAVARIPPGQIQQARKVLAALAAALTEE